jgi:hypothetical protein
MKNLEYKFEIQFQWREIKLNEKGERIQKIEKKSWKKQKLEKIQLPGNLSKTKNNVAKI